MPFLDTFGNVLAIPNKLMFLTADFESHVIDPQIEAEVRRFLDRHELHHVHVRLNEYDPMGELWRLLTNRRVGLFLRLLLGPLLWLAYLLNVGRLFGGDHYNAFSDTVNLYSNHMSIAIHEMGHALDFRRRRWPGLYALLRFVPGVALYQEYLASLYAIEHFRERGMDDEEIRAYRLLFPAYSTYVFGTLVDLFPSAGAKWVLAPCIAVGHVLGNYFAQQRLAALQTERITLAGQWLHEKDRAVVMFSPATVDGRGQLGVLLGMLAGSTLCGPGGPLGAYVGFLLARNAGR
jgi:hypothetical protein